MYPQHALRIAGWTIYPREHRLCKNGTVVKLEPKAMHVLLCLIDRPGEAVTRQELAERVWSGVIVSDEALSNAINKLRKAFSDETHKPRIIQTIPKVGYRLVAPVEPVFKKLDIDDDYPAQETITSLPAQVSDSDEHSTGKVKSGQQLRTWKKLWPALAALTLLIVGIYQTQVGIKLSSPEQFALPLPDKPSIAVLPFTNMSDDPGQEYFADGITEDLITTLSRIDGIFVIARNSTFAYKGRIPNIRIVAEELGVRYVLEGSVRRSGQTVRINAKLIDATTSGYIWAERYDSELTNVFSLQDKVTGKIVEALSIKLTDEERIGFVHRETTSPAAYDALLHGLEHLWRWSPDGFAAAHTYFQKAVALDQNYARAHGALATIYWETWKRNWHSSFGWQFAAWERAEKTLQEAMLQPTPLAHQVASEMLLMNRRFGAAIAEAEHAIALHPNDARSYVTLAEALTFAGHPEEAIGLIQKAMRFDPHFPASYLFAMGRAQFSLERFNEAASSLERATNRNADDRLPYILLVATYGQLGHFEKAQAALSDLNARQINLGLSDFTIDALRDRWPYKEPEDLERLKEGLRRAGVPAW